MITYTLKGSHIDAIKRSSIFTIKVHAVKHQISQGIGHHLTLTAQSIHISLQITDSFLLPTFHIMLILDLRVRDGNIIEFIRYLFPLLQNEIMPVVIFNKFIHANIKTLSKTLLAGKHIRRRSGYTDELADIGISRQGPFPKRVGLHKTSPIVYNHTRNTLTLAVFNLTGKNKRRSLLGYYGQWHCPNKH